MNEASLGPILSFEKGSATAREPRGDAVESRVVSFGKSDASAIRTAYELSAGLLSFVVALGIGWWVGRWLDARFGTAPWQTAIFSALGLVAGILNVYRTLSRAFSEKPSGTP